MNDLLEFITANYRANRTTVTDDIQPILEQVADLAGLPLTLHRFPSGTEHGTWIVPPAWNVNEAWLKDPDGKIIASYDDHPLFLAPYTLPFSGKVTLEELKEHTGLHPSVDNAYYYEHRLAYDYRRRLKEWRITLPRTLLNALPEGEYEVHIDVEVSDGEMLIGEIALPGKTDTEIALLADYCHPGQVNDSFTGIAVMVDVLRRLQSSGPHRHTYKLYLFAETIGSCIFLAANPDLAERTATAIFSEFVGWGKEWVLSSSRNEDTLASRMATTICTEEEDITHKRFFDQGTHENDELIFEYAGIPSLSLHRFGQHEYHSSLDEPSRIEIDSMQRASDVVHRLCMIAEQDRVYQHTQNVPIYMTRFGLYLDGFMDLNRARTQKKLLYAIDGKRSLLEICNKEDIDFIFAAELTDKLREMGFLKTV